MGKHRKTVKGWIVFGKGKDGYITPIRVKTRWQDAMDFARKMWEGGTLADEGITVRVRGIPIDYYEEDLP